MSKKLMSVVLGILLVGILAGTAMAGSEGPVMRSVSIQRSQLR